MGILHDGYIFSSIYREIIVADDKLNYIFFLNYESTNRLYRSAHAILIRIIIIIIILIVIMILYWRKKNL